MHEGGHYSLTGRLTYLYIFYVYKYVYVYEAYMIYVYLCIYTNILCVRGRSQLSHRQAPCVHVNIQTFRMDTYT